MRRFTHREFFDCATTNLLRQSAIPFKLSLEINDFYSTFFCNSDKHEFKVFLILSSEQYLITCRENKGEWFGMMYLLGAIRRLIIHPAKFDNFKDEKKNRVKNCLSSTKPNTCWTKNSWSSGIMSNFLGQFFYVLGGKKKS